MGANRLIRLGAARRAMLEHRASVATTPGRKIIPVKWFLSTKNRSYMRKFPVTEFT